MIAETKIPVYARIALALITLYILIHMLSIAQNIIVPIIYAVLIAILLSPVVDFLARKKINSFVAIAIVMVGVSIFLAGIILVLGMQLSRFIEILPQLKLKFHELMHQLNTWLSEYFNISKTKISTWINQTKNEVSPGRSNAIGTTLNITGGLLSALFLMPVYVFMMLYYRLHIIRFIHTLFGSENNKKVTEVLTETNTIIKSYVIGLFTEFIIMAILNSAGLLLLGIDYAILLGIAGALLNIVPYLGGIIAMGLFMMVALVTKTPVYALYVAVMYTTIQFIDNNYIVPRIIGSKVKLNALVSLIAVIAGAALWGISGMFLSIPIMAIVKLTLDKTEMGKPWGFLLGEYVVMPIKKKKTNLKPI